MQWCGTRAVSTLTLWTAGRYADVSPFKSKSASASGNYVPIERVQRPRRGAASQTEGVAVMENDLSEFDLTLIRLLYLFPLVVWGLLIYFAFS